VLEALAQRVPQVASPVTHGQPGVAARISTKKSGVVVSAAEFTSAGLSLALDEIFKDSTYRDDARYVQKRIAETDGLSMAADIVERSFGVAKKRADRFAESV
jgi:UDP:flavonoid glycosyltransferase YjiC (YdhE family)